MSNYFCLKCDSVLCKDDLLSGSDVHILCGELVYNTCDFLDLYNEQKKSLKFWRDEASRYREMANYRVEDIAN